MMLGKRPRHQIRRTASMSGVITMDLSRVEDQELSDNDVHLDVDLDADAAPPDEHVVTHNVINYSVLVPPRPKTGPGPGLRHRNLISYSDRDLTDTAQFLHSCGLCNRRLPPGRDIYMYRGDTAFCSLECREEQMKQDEGIEKSTSTTSTESRKSQKVAAA